MTESEIDPLPLPYAHTRIEWPERVFAMASSMERFEPVIAVTVLREGINSFFLIDGTLRD